MLERLLRMDYHGKTRIFGKVPVLKHLAELEYRVKMRILRGKKC